MYARLKHFYFNYIAIPIAVAPFWVVWILTFSLLWMIVFPLFVLVYLPWSIDNHFDAMAHELEQRMSPVIDGPVKAWVESVYDGDTVTVQAYPWPQVTHHIKIRLDHLDTPEINHRAKCPEEHALGIQARDRLRELINEKVVLLRNIRPDKYGGRMDATLSMEDDTPVAPILIKEALARPYDGGKRESWCN